MNDDNHEQLTTELTVSGMPPSLLLTRSLEVYNVDFQSVEFLIEEELSALNWATLELARSIGMVTPKDLDSYLGFGPTLSHLLLESLAALELVETSEGPQKRKGRVDTVVDRVRSWARMSPKNGGDKAVQRKSAFAVRESTAAESPKYELTHSGRISLEANQLLTRAKKPITLTFCVSPLWFLATSDERSAKWAVGKKAPPLDPGEVPRSLRAINLVLGLEGPLREHNFGVQDSLNQSNNRLDTTGRLLGVPRGEQWEVREPREGASKATHAFAILLDDTQKMVEAKAVIHYLRKTREIPLGDADTNAALGGAFGETLQAKAEEGNTEPDAVSGETPEFLLNELEEQAKAVRDIPDFSGALEKFRSEHDVLKVAKDGAHVVFYTESEVDKYCDQTSSPAQSFTFLPGNYWSAHIRIHPIPKDPQTEFRAFVVFLKRRTMGLQFDFGKECQKLADELAQFWGWPFVLPAPDVLEGELWKDATFKKAICARRMADDLIHPYSEASQ